MVQTNIPIITPDIAHKLGFYVYAYIDPRDGTVFYVGKGVGTRATDHLVEQSESAKVNRINSIRADGLEPVIEIVAYQLRDDLESSRVEAAIIEVLGVDKLNNIVKGRFSSDFPKRSLQDFIVENSAESVDVTVPALLIRINKQFRYGMSESELYECTRGIWVIGERRNAAKYAMAVYAGVVREVYAIESWHRAGSTPYINRNQAELAKLRDKRWEFVGAIADQEIRSQYYGKSVGHLFSAGQQNPIVGLNLETS